MDKTANTSNEKLRIEIAKAFFENKKLSNGQVIITSELLESIDKILSTYPTCGVEQRKFLNEIEKSDIDNEIMWDTFIMNDGKGNSTKVIGANFSNMDIPNVDLYKVIKGE